MLWWLRKRFWERDIKGENSPSPAMNASFSTTVIETVDNWNTERKKYSVKKPNFKSKADPRV